MLILYVLGGSVITNELLRSKIADLNCTMYQYVEYN